MTIKIIHCCSLPGRHIFRIKEKKLWPISRRKQMNCVHKTARIISPAPSFYVRTTYIMWATAGTTGTTKVTVLNLRSRNTKQTQAMRVTQQQHSTAQAVKLQQWHKQQRWRRRDLPFSFVWAIHFKFQGLRFFQVGFYKWDHTAVETVDFVGGCMHSSQLQGETVQLGNTKQRHTWWASHNYSRTAAAAQQRRQRRRTRRSTARSTSNVALSHVLVCIITKSHVVLPHRGVASAQKKVEGWHVCHIEKKNCNMQVAHLYDKPATKRQLWLLTKLNKIWKAHQ